MKRDRAAYMREYRKRLRRETIMAPTMPAQAVRDLVDAQDRIRTLEAEVAQLKAENQAHRERFVSHGRPVAGMTQVERDAILRKLNRTK